MLGFLFELDAPNDALKEGKIVYQYVTYKKADNITIAPISIGCKTKVGDPYVSEVKTFNGTNSLASTSSFVQNRTWSQQNTEDKARKKDSYGLSQESVFYKKESSDQIAGNSLQPYLAQIEFNGKLNSTDPIFGTYNVTVGGRIYANDTDTNFVSLPSNSYQIQFGQPQTDLSVLYEEQVDESQAATLVYMEERFKFFINDVFPSSGISLLQTQLCFPESI